MFLVKTRQSRGVCIYSIPRAPRPSCGSDVPTAATRCKECFFDFTEKRKRSIGPIVLMAAFAVMAILGALMIWTTGTLCRFTVSTRPGLLASLHLVFIGVFATPPLWFLLAARYARVRLLFERREVYLALAIPSALAYLALLARKLEPRAKLRRRDRPAPHRAGARLSIVRPSRNAGIGR